MSNIENRIVHMTFDNASFERHIAATLDSLDQLNRSIQLLGAAQGLSDVSQAAQDVDFTNIADSLDNISNKFSLMGAVGLSVLMSLTDRAIDFASSISSMTIEPILSGGRGRASNIEQAMFMFRGLEMDIDAAMESARIAVTGTAYGLDSAAKAASQLGGSGLQAGDEMTSALRGIAGIAAMTNTSYDEMADIFVSAAGKGRVMSNELARISHRGVNAAASLAKVWGITEAEVRHMASSGEISFEMFYQAMDEAFGEHATKANETYAGSLSNVRAALSRVGASWFGPQMEQQRDLFNALMPLVDNFHDAIKPLITTMLDIRRVGIDNLIGFINGISFDNLNKAVPNFSKALQNIMGTLRDLGGVIKDAFRDIFPPSEFSLLVKVSEVILNLSERIKMGGKTLDAVRSIFRGFFSVISIGIEIVKNAALFFRDLVSIAASLLGFNGGGILNFFGNLGESLTKLKESLVDGGRIEKFFSVFRDGVDITSPKLEIFRSLIDRIKTRLGQLKDVLFETGGVFDFFGGIVDKITPLLSGIWKIFGELFGHLSTWLSELGQNLANGLSAGDFKAVFDVLNVGLLGGIALMLKKFFDDGILGSIVGGGLIEKITEVFDGLTGVLTAMQTDIKAGALMKIATAVAILTASLLVLSLIDSVSLTKALTAVAISLGQLMVTMTAISKLDLAGGGFKLMALGVSFILLATAVSILAIAVKSLSKLGWEELSKGLLGVTVLLAGLTASTQLISSNTSGLVRAGISLIAISIALLILSKAVKSFAQMDWAELGKGLVGVAAGLAILVLAVNNLPKGMIAQGLGLIAISTSLLILASAVEKFAQLSWSEMGKGLLGIAGGLLVIAIAMNLMPKDMVLRSIGIAILSGALLILASAVKKMGSIGILELAKGIGAIAITLGILAIALIMMQQTIGGAAALLVAALALNILTGVLERLGNLGIGQIITSLLTLAATLAIIAGAAILLTPLVPTMLGFGAAMMLIGAAFALFGVGATLVAGAIAALVKAGELGITTIGNLIQAFILNIPGFVGAIVLALVEIATELIAAAPALIEALGVLLGQLLDTIIELAPKIVTTVVTLIREVLRGIRELFPEFVRTGMEMLLSLLRGVRDNIGEIATTVADIIVNFLNALSEKLPEIVDAVYNFVLTVITTVAGKFLDIGSLLISPGIDFIGGFLSGMVEKFVDVLSWVVGIPIAILSKIGDLAGRLVSKGRDLITGLFRGSGEAFVDSIIWWQNLPENIKNLLGNLTETLWPKGIEIISGFLSGITEKATNLANWFLGLPGQILGWIGSLLGHLKDKGIELIQGLINGVTNKVTDLMIYIISIPDKIVGGIPNPGNILREVGKKIMDGLLGGLRAGWESVKGFLGNVTSWIPDIKGPPAHDKVMLYENGMFIMQGLQRGMEHSWEDISTWLNRLNAADYVRTDMFDGFDSTFARVRQQLNELDGISPTITPVLDLSLIEREAQRIQGLLSVSDIHPDVSFNQARTISTTAEREDTSSEPTYEGPQEIQFIQNNYSPEALSTNDIYRNTKSQIAVAKEELGL